MKLKCVTCSGTNEFTKIDDLFALYQEFPSVEFGIQVSGKKCSAGSARLVWLNNLKNQVLRKRKSLPLALHLNQDWVEGFCDGIKIPELQELLSWTDRQGNPIFQRVQLNFKIGRNKAPEIGRLESQMKKYPHLRFILSYNDANADLIWKIYQRRQVVFDCLFDESFGEGVAPSQRHPPVFDDVIQGYAGGLSPDNVSSELEKIAELVPLDAVIFVDAEGKLKGEDGHFDYVKAREYVANALSCPALQS